MNLTKKVIATAMAASLAALWTSTASAQETAVVVPEPGAERIEREQFRPNRPMLAAGLGVIAASYIPAVAVAATSEHDGDEHLYIPIAGPWMDLVDRGGCANDSCSEEAVYKTLLVTAGIAHLVGTGLVISSLVVPEERTRRVSASTKPMVMPGAMGKSGAGLTLVGAF